MKILNKVGFVLGVLGAIITIVGSYSAIRLYFNSATTIDAMLFVLASLSIPTFYVIYLYMYSEKRSHFFLPSLRLITYKGKNLKNTYLECFYDNYTKSTHYDNRFCPEKSIQYLDNALDIYHKYLENLNLDLNPIIPQILADKAGHQIKVDMLKADETYSKLIRLYEEYIETNSTIKLCIANAYFGKAVVMFKIRGFKIYEKSSDTIEVDSPPNGKNPCSLFPQDDIKLIMWRLNKAIKYHKELGFEDSDPVNRCNSLLKKFDSIKNSC